MFFAIHKRVVCRLLRLAKSREGTLSTSRTLDSTAIPSLSPFPFRATHTNSRGQLWRGKNIGPEAIVVVQELKKHRHDEVSLGKALDRHARRLLKPDMLACLDELQRQRFWQLSLKVFQLAQKEIWYEPDPEIYSNLIRCLGKCGQHGLAAELLDEMKMSGVAPTREAYFALVTSHARAGLWQESRRFLSEMREIGVSPHERVLKELADECEKAGHLQAAAALRKERVALISDISSTPRARVVIR